MANTGHFSVSCSGNLEVELHRPGLLGMFRRPIVADCLEFSLTGIQVESNVEFKISEHLIVDLKYRYYDQGAADFYSDLFERQQAQNFLARDKELATFTTHTAGIGLAWEFDLADRIGFLKRGEISAMADYIRFSYDDFRDLRTTGVTPGTEPLYEFDSLVLRIFVSFWY